MRLAGILKRGIPGYWPGILFLCSVGMAQQDVSLRLAEELFEERDWKAARTEALRSVQAAGSSESSPARLISALASLRSGEEREAALAELERIWNDPQAPLETRCRAGYEGALAHWADHDRSTALPALRFAFLHTRDTSLFWRAGCSLYFLLKADRRMRRNEPGLWQAIQSCREAWPLDVWRECRPKRRATTLRGALPARAIVALYRSQISPAIGARCDMEPSCSEYFVQASRRHGLLGIPMMANRLVREPSLVSESRNPVLMPDGRIRQTDPPPLHHHRRRTPSPRP